MLSLSMDYFEELQSRICDATVGIPRSVSHLHTIYLWAIV